MLDIRGNMLTKQEIFAAIERIDYGWFWHNAIHVDDLDDGCEIQRTFLINAEGEDIYVTFDGYVGSFDDYSWSDAYQSEPKSIKLVQYERI